MDFTESEHEAAFRAEVRAWLATVSEPRQPRAVPTNAIVAEWGPDEEREKIEAARRWQAAKFDAGWAGITWPRDIGGRGGTRTEGIVFSQEESKREVPRGELAVGLGWLGPMIDALGTDEQRARLLPPLLRGDEVWCQLFSEPGAGSDLAALATAAERDGSEWRITGQKVWTTFAHMSDWAVCLARTDPTVPKHRGITAFVLDMHQSAVECRPLRQMTGSANFNEVFLDGAVARDEDRIGEVGDGWRAAMVTFMHERTSGSGAELGVSQLVDLARGSGHGTDPVVRQRVARIYSQARVLEFSGYRMLTKLLQGGMPGPESSTAKLAFTRMSTDMNDLALTLQGPAGVLDGGDAPLEGGWQAYFLGMPGIRIGGGTDEIQRNIIGERVLGLPGEPRVDKEIPFEEVPR
ncbi:MAG: acyl-CoA dehydrogenase family protein [Acidimicrobiia bacterium]|nr:acyl-CoA dehydrogenase family protein [Acidimicrobiia bacterium]